MSNQLALEVYKTLNNLNPVFMKDYFVPKTTGHNLRLKNLLDIPRARTTKNGSGADAEKLTTAAKDEGGSGGVAPGKFLR